MRRHSKQWKIKLKNKMALNAVSIWNNSYLNFLLKKIEQKSSVATLNINF